eukprot:scaffold10910_cov23-Tisochrysis_lutea.AAC.2
MCDGQKAVTAEHKRGWEVQCYAVFKPKEKRNAIEGSSDRALKNCSPRSDSACCCAKSLVIWLTVSDIVLKGVRTYMRGRHGHTTYWRTCLDAINAACSAHAGHLTGRWDILSAQ